MGVGDESTFLLKKNLIGWVVWERKYFIGLLNIKIALSWN